MLHTVLVEYLQASHLVNQGGDNLPVWTDIGKTRIY